MTESTRAVPRRGGPFTRAVGRIALRVLRWRIEGTLPAYRKFIIIAAPHRTNWDFIVGLAAKFALGLDASWLGKHTLFRGPWAPLFRYWGGIPVDRRTSHDTVAMIVERFASSDTLRLALAPEGTRTPGAPWKTGFWHIANRARVPIVPVAFDWPRRTVRIMACVETRDLEQDMIELQARYRELLGASDAADDADAARTSRISNATDD